VSKVKGLIEKAERFLHTAEYVLSEGDYDSCASRCYYAMFFMAEAALLTKNMSGSSHRRVISLFGEHFVKTGVFEKYLGRVFNNAYDQRLVGDYAVGLAIAREEAESLLEAAQDFVGKVKDYLDRWTQQQQ
jgi:uncharacterized protein (UPF0332 family)